MATAEKPKTGAKGKGKAKEAAATAVEEVVMQRSPEEEAAILAIADIQSHVKLVKRGVHSQESRHISRVIRTIPRLRKRLTAGVLWHTLQECLPAEAEAARTVLQGYLPSDAANDAVVKAALAPPPKLAPKEGEKADEEGDSMDVAKDGAAPAKPKVGEAKSKQLPYVTEVELYLTLLVLLYVLDAKRLAEAMKLSEAFLNRCVATTRRSSDHLAARAYFYYARTRELNGSTENIRSILFSGLRTATLRCDEPGQATILNLLLRNMVQGNLIEQARLLISKTKFPESASNNEHARYQFYYGWIDAVQLEYTEADRHLTQAVRKAPNSAIGFLQAATKLQIIVKLLLGEIPERTVFRKPDLRRSLKPLFKLTKAVRVGDLKMFSAVVTEFQDIFRKDKTYTLILRLRHNVIKTGARMINLSYSRISLADIAKKLQLDSAEDAEFIVAKAIRDGVIEAVIDHKEGSVKSKDMTDIYSTTEPQEAFHKRIQFCLKLHNDSVKAMRYPPNAYRKYLETPEQRREREMLEETELAEELEEDD